MFVLYTHRETSHDGSRERDSTFVADGNRRAISFPLTALQNVAAVSASTTKPDDLCMYIGSIREVDQAESNVVNFFTLSIWFSTYELGNFIFLISTSWIFM